MTCLKRKAGSLAEDEIGSIDNPAKLEVFKLQASHEGHTLRDVRKTVSCQLMLAIEKRKMAQQNRKLSQVEKSKLKHSKAYLDGMSAHEFPLRWQHLQDSVHPHSDCISQLLLISRVCWTSDLFDSTRICGKLSRSEVICIWNQSMLDVPRAARLCDMSPFRHTASEKQAGMSGKLRRDMLPFLWTCIMGV